MALPNTKSSQAGQPGSLYPVALNGQPFLVDLSRDAGFVERTIPLLTTRIDDSGQVSEQTLNPEDLLRRAVDSCHHGAGQRYRDRPDSNPFRYRASYNIDVWDRDRIGLHRLTEAMSAGVDPVGDHSQGFWGNPLIATDENKLIAADGDQGIRYYNGSTWASVGSTPAANLCGLAFDGVNAYAAYNTSGIYTFVPGGSASSLFTGTVTAVGFAKGRLLAADQAGNLYNPTDFSSPPNALPDPLMTLNEGYFTHFAEGTNHIYLAARVGRRSFVYKTAVKPDGTALDVPTLAATLPDGETVCGLYGYLGFVFIGVSGGGNAVRMGQAQSDGSLVLGPPIQIHTGNAASAVSFEGEGRFVWCTAKTLNYFSPVGERDRSGDGLQGLFRLDLSVFNGPLQPAFAPDVVIADPNPEGEVIGVCKIGSGTEFGSGGLCFLYQQPSGDSPSADVYEVQSNYVYAADGDIYFGRVTYGVPDAKVFMYLDVEAEATHAGVIDDDLSDSTATWSAELIDPTPGGSNLTITSGQTGSAVLPLSAFDASEAELHLTLSRGADSQSNLVFRRITLRSFVAANRTREFVLPLVMKPTLSVRGQTEYMKPSQIMGVLPVWLGTVVVLQVGTREEYVQIKDYAFHIDYWDEELGEFGGICLVKCQVVQ